jgi:hypothetical protein
MTDTFETFMVKKIAADQKLSPTEKLVAIVFMFVSEPTEQGYLRVSNDIAEICGLSIPEFEYALDKIVAEGWAVSAQAVRDVESSEPCGTSERTTLH